MARFRARCQAREGNPASRVGDERAWAEVTGEHVGAEILAAIDPVTETEAFEVYATHGRRGKDQERIYLGKVELQFGTVVFQPALTHQGRRLVTP